jgi:hypothetical protein
MEKKLIEFIKKTEPYYRFANMSGYTKEQLKQVEERLKAKSVKKNKRAV